MAAFAKDLAAIADGDEPVYGGKAVGLARLLSTGARVPPGFALPAHTGLPDEWPDAWRAELRERAAALMSVGPVAVRSSAPGEDAAARSFAGLFETVLGVSTSDALFEAAARCIRSGAGERVRAYAGGDGAHPVGIVVQSQVKARAAGVCFTIDPAGKDGAVVVEAVRGTGDALVSGRATPERWRLYESGLGGWEAQRDSDGGLPPVLTAEEAVEIARDASARAAAAGHPLDLEWALDDRHLWWLQARPITAAATPPVIDIERYFTLVDDGPVTVWANWNVREVMPDPFTPLNWSVWRDHVLPVVIENVFGVPRASHLFPHVAGIDFVHGRVYWNMNALLAGPLGGLLTRGVLAHLDARAAEVTQRLRAQGVLRPRRLPASAARMALLLSGRMIAGLFRVGSALRPRHAVRLMDECARSIAARPDVASLTDAELMGELAIMGGRETRALRDAQQLLIVAFFVHAAAERVFRDHPRARRLLAAGIEGNPTTQISLGVDALVEAARPLAATFAQPLSTPELLGRLQGSPPGAAWLVRLREFLGRFGQRCPNEFDIATPRWAEDPTMIVDLVRAGVRGQGQVAGDRLARMAAQRREAVAEASACSSWWRRPLLAPAARLVELYMPLREAPKHYAMFAFQRMRMAALELGRRLAARGWIDSARDVMFLDRVELEAVGRGDAASLDLRALVAQRKARHERHLSERPPHFVRSDGVPVPEDGIDDAPAADGSLRGVGASTGAATGPVRILRAPDAAAMSDGDVLVVEFADPGWTPLFPRASALVMEVGGLMCHAAVVARELGVPAVFGVPGATRHLRDGQRVRVDGEAGTVTPA
jgi:pyruvate,water dikinase